MGGFWDGMARDISPRPGNSGRVARSAVFPPNWAIFHWNWREENGIRGLAVSWAVFIVVRGILGFLYWKNYFISFFHKLRHSATPGVLSGDDT